MRVLYREPIDQLLAERWNKIDPAYKKAFFFVLAINFLAFGFEMTNLTLHHDDVAYIFIQDTILGHYLGRFGLGWLNYYTQNAYYMPFLQMFEGIVLMTAYGMLVSHFWGLRRTMDIVLVSAILCVFPYMANLFSYNVVMATIPVAYLLAAGAVVLSVRMTMISIAAASAFYVAAFSIYQSVIANAATIFSIWMLGNLLFRNEKTNLFSKKILMPIAGTLAAVIVGGTIYIIIVSSMDINFGSYQAAGEAFSLKSSLNLMYAVSEVIHGTRAFFLWPENYFPSYLKMLQLLFVVAAGIVCLWLPTGLVNKLVAAMIFVVALVTPRILQFIHPQGVFHSNALTGYALAIAGCVMIVIRSRHVIVRNLTVVLTTGLIAGYILQCNWISTVNYLNTLAHYTTMTQILTRIKSLPAEQWDGGKVYVVGHYNMSADYPYKRATGVATTYVDGPHMRHLARLMREDVTFVVADKTTPRILEYASNTSPWPHPESIGTHDGVAVVVLSNDRLERDP